MLCQPLPVKVVVTNEQLCTYVYIIGAAIITVVVEHQHVLGIKELAVVLNPFF
jgi:hypothetical protein